MVVRSNHRLIDFMGGFQLRIVDSGYAEVGNDWRQQQVHSPYARLYLIYGGEARLHLPDGLIPLKTGSACLIPADFTFDYSCDESMQQLYFHLNLYAIDGRDILAHLDTCLETPLPLNQLNAILDAYQGETLADALILQQAITGLVADFVSRASFAAQAIQPPSAFLGKVYQMARATVNARTNIGYLADKLAMAPSTLSRKFKSETGITLGHYLDGLLIQRAQQLLLSTEDPIGRIAETLGFCDQFYFSRWFRQHREETPSQYRKRRRDPFSPLSFQQNP